MRYPKQRKIYRREKSEYRYIVFTVIIISLLQFWALKNYFEEVETKIPTDLFSSPIKFPIAELTPEKNSSKFELALSKIVSETKSSEPEQPAKEEYISEESTSDDFQVSENPQTLYSNNLEDETALNDIQKKITLRALEMLEEDIEYGYKYYPETGYPSDNVYISTDVIAVVLRDCGYDLMELIYEDMSEHTEAYPMEIKGSDSVNKYMDFRHVFFQQTFFNRHGLELPTEYDPDDENNIIQWQPGDIVFFQMDKDNPQKDLAGIISPNKNEQGIPLVIMNSEELGKVSEADILLEYEIKGHYRYPYPEIE